MAVLDFIVEVEKADLPAWESVERVLGADWGVHTFLTATAVDEHNKQVGRPIFLNTGGFDGRQARTRRQIDVLKKKVATYEHERDALPSDHSKRLWFNQKLALFRREIDRCWRKYEQRNRAMAHFASNVLVLSPRAWLLASLDGVFKNLEIHWARQRRSWALAQLPQQLDDPWNVWRLLRYKCHLIGLRFNTRTTSRHFPHLPALWSACQNLSRAL